MPRQVVQAYYFSTKSNVDTIEEQINTDLKKHSDWSVHLISFLPEYCMCYVVYNIDDTLERPADQLKPNLDPLPSQPLNPVNPFEHPRVNPFNPLERNPCEDCWFYKQRKNDTKPYVGDAPCQWCRHYPWRITNGTGDKPQ